MFRTSEPAELRGRHRRLPPARLGPRSAGALHPGGGRPPRLVARPRSSAVIQTESRFDPLRRVRARARRASMQLMPADRAPRRHREPVRPAPEHLGRDEVPEPRCWSGTRGTRARALAAYNAGPTVTWRATAASRRYRETRATCRKIAEAGGQDTDAAFSRAGDVAVRKASCEEGPRAVAQLPQRRARRRPRCEPRKARKVHGEEGRARGAAKKAGQPRASKARVRRRAQPELAAGAVSRGPSRSRRRASARPSRARGACRRPPRPSRARAAVEVRASISSTARLVFASSARGCASPPR